MNNLFVNKRQDQLLVQHHCLNFLHCSGQHTGPSERRDVHLTLLVEADLCIHLSLSHMGSPALAPAAVTSGTMPTTKEVGSILPTMYFRSRSFSLKLWQHVRIFLLMALS